MVNIWPKMLIFSHPSNFENLLSFLFFWVKIQSIQINFYWNKVLIINVGLYCIYYIEVKVPWILLNTYLMNKSYKTYYFLCFALFKDLISSLVSLFLSQNLYIFLPPDGLVAYLTEY